MRLISLLLVLAFCGSSVVDADTSLQNEVKGRLSERTNTKIGLELTTTIVEETSCAPDQLSLALQLKLTNIGREPVILDKRTSVNRYLSSYMVSGSLNHAGNHRYEQVWRMEDFGSSEPFPPPSAMSGFVILKHGEAYDVADF